MGRNYWIHRISHFAEISYPLLDSNYLSFGYVDFAEDGFIDKLRAEGGQEYLDKIFIEAWGYKDRNRWQLWNFVCEMKAGDWVIVPNDGEFSICELLDDEPLMIKDIKDVVIKDWNGKEILRDKEGYLINTDNSRIDLGFARRIKMVKKGISRYDYADSDLTSRLKVRQTNVCINDLEESVLKALNNHPIRLRNELEEIVPDICDIIQTKLNPNKFEYLVKWYFERIGASSVTIPPKNSSNKVDYEDVDVIATFDLLKTMFYIQVKYHRGETNDWATKQISHYKELEDDRQDDGYTRVYWVLSSSESFSQDCINLAKETNVQLIDGKSFASMLLDAGFLGVGDFKSTSPIL